MKNPFSRFVKDCSRINDREYRYHEGTVFMFKKPGDSDEHHITIHANKMIVRAVLTTKQLKELKYHGRVDTKHVEVEKYKPTEDEEDV